MERVLRQYLAAEKQAGLLFLAIGVIALSVGLLSIFSFQTMVWKGMASALIPIALLQLTVGSTIYFRTNKQLSNLLDQLAKNPNLFVREELERMNKINAQFKIYRNVELLLFLLGFVFVLMGGLANWGMLTLGIGIGLSSQCALMLILDLFAEFRAGMYTHQLESFSEKL